MFFVKSQVLIIIALCAGVCGWVADSSDDNVDVEAGVTRTNSGCFACFKKYACADPAFFVTSAVDAADSVNVSLSRCTYLDCTV